MQKTEIQKFYDSKLWKDVKKAVWLRQNCLCAKCNKPVYVSGISDVKIDRRNKITGIVHHITPINEENFSDDNITINYDNLVGLCLSCHTSVHHPNNCIKEGYMFDENGMIVKSDGTENDLRKFIKL